MEDLQAFIDALKERLPIETVIGQRVRLTRRGNRYWGLCPFHAEKSPSFTVESAKGFYKCFGCGKAGDLITFVRETEGLEFMEALRVLADQAGVVLPATTGGAGGRASADLRSQAREALQHARRFFVERLRTTEGEGAREYLRGRGVSAEIIHHFALGWAPRDRQALIGALRAKQIPEEAMEMAGLALRDEEGRGGRKDRFWERLIFPVQDAGGRTVGFGGRYLPGSFAEEKSLGKYVNSPEGPMFPKRRILYGLDLLSAALRDAPEEPVLVVEGYLDVILLHQAGLRTAVAALGTALTEEHARRLRRFERPVILLLDGDAAGRRAAAKAARNLIAEGLDVRVAELPDGSDPADLVSSGRAAELHPCLAESRDILRWRIETWKHKADLTVPAVAHQAAEEMAGWIATTPSPVVAEAWSRLAAEGLGVSESALRKLVRGSGASAAPSPPGGSSAQPPPQRTAQEALTANEREIVLALLKDPSAYALFRPALDALKLRDSAADAVLLWVREQRTSGEDGSLDRALLAFSGDAHSSAWLDAARHLAAAVSPALLLERALEALPARREEAAVGEARGRSVQVADLHSLLRPVSVSPNRDPAPPRSTHDSAAPASD